MSAAEATTIGDSLCRAVAAVHRVGLLHRDIKGSNVMRESGGRIVLLDFGTGSELEVASARAAAPRIAGTPLYLAPELFDGVPPSVQSDLYSLGVLLFHLVTGSYPVVGKSIEDIYLAHQEGRRALLADLRPDLPQNFVDVVERAISPRPNDRYQSAGAMRQELTAAAPSLAPAPAPTDETPGSSIMARAIPVAGEAAAALLLVTALGYVTSGVFNTHLGIGGDFVQEGPLTYAALGAQNLIPTLVYMGIGVLLYYAWGAVVHLMTSAVPRLGQWVHRTKEAWRQVYHRLNLDDANAMAKTVCAVGVVIFGAICYVFRDVIVGVTSRIDVAPIETLSILHPMYVRTHVLYGLSLDMLLLNLLFGLFQVRRARRTSHISSGPVVGMVVLAGLALLLHAAAWRVLFRNEVRQATFEGQTCYVLARNVDEVLLHCPHLPAPRNRVVGRTDPGLALTGRVEQLSSAFLSESP
jgi:hypothetical protein